MKYVIIIPEGKNLVNNLFTIVVFVYAANTYDSLLWNIFSLFSTLCIVFIHLFILEFCIPLTYICIFACYLHIFVHFAWLFLHLSVDNWM